MKSPLYVVDASVVVRWFVEQPGFEAAIDWLHRYAENADLLVAPDLLMFEVAGALAKLQPKRHPAWAAQCFQRFLRLGLRQLPTTPPLVERAFHLARSVPMGGYAAIYLAHAESLRIAWLTADERILRRLQGDPRIRGLCG